MTKEERNIVIRAVKDNPDKKYEQIAAELGISRMTPTILMSCRSLCRRIGGEGRGDSWAGCWRGLLIT